MMIIITQNIMIFIMVKIFLRNLHFQKMDLFFLFVNIPVGLILFNFSQLAAVVGAVSLLFIYLLLLTKNIKSSILVLVLIYGISLLIDHLIDILFQALGISDPHEVFYSLMMMVMGIVLDIIIFLSFRKSFEKGLHDFYQFSNSEIVLSLGTLFLMIGLVILTEVMQNNNMENIIYNFVISVLIMAMFFIIHIIHIKVIKNDFELQEQKERSESTNRYIYQIEKHYNELRKFRHEYQNTLLSLDEYLKSDDLEGLKAYYNESIKPISFKLNQEKYKFEDLSRVNNKEIKSIIFNKLYAAQISGIKVSFEAKDEIKDFHMDSLDLALAFGIILDNAIEETQKQNNGTIQVGLIKNSSSIVIIVQNSLRKNDIPVWKMKEIGFSSKGTNRGLGLKNLKEIIDRNRNATLETMKLDNYFLQKITINLQGEYEHD
ncbi:sensor histidine kinase [Companilactobacillus alimentarius]|uniref:sensor histidine kinase n=1 Tax=Companilactobacillus alimentarius TaxID=1602 RepID=UPI0028B41011|nr:GHKL domain-containing protein [Companilactobacillus alimentarius]MDT6951396.1 GHKL domain-containing protein [Companilactobacillus alimentarius]